MTSLLLFYSLSHSYSWQLYGPKPNRLLYPWDSPGKNTVAGCRFFLQEIFLTQGSNLSLLHWQADSSAEETPTRARTSFPHSQSLPSRSLHKSLLSSSFRGQTEARAIIPQPPEQKPQSQKANQNDHMNHSLLVVKGHV